MEREKVLILEEVAKAYPGHINAIVIANKLNIDLNKVKVCLDEMESSNLVRQIKTTTFESDGELYEAQITPLGRLELKNKKAIDNPVKLQQEPNKPFPNNYDKKKVILILSANPKNSDSLRLAEEIREIKEGLRRSKNRDRFRIETCEAVRYRDIQRALLDIEPNILHFSGHGAAEQGLVFEDKTGNSFLVKASALTNLFELFADRLECVVLNACFSQVQAGAIVKHIPYAIGMNEAIDDRAAIEFAVGFYDALGAGKDVNFAYKLGCSAIDVAGRQEHLTPQLLTKESFENLASQQNSPSSK